MNELSPFFNELNIYFDHIYIITLERATERHDHIQKELQGLQYELFFGKDKNNFSLEELKSQNIYNDDLAKKHHRYGKSMQPGAIGCAWSHAAVYQDTIKNNYQRVLILEDDIVINKNTAYLFAEILKVLPKNWELLYFGFAGGENIPANAFFKKLFYHSVRFLKGIKFTHRTISNLYPREITKNLYAAGYHDCTHAYAITISAAKKLLQLQTPISFLSDNLLAFAATNKLLNSYIIMPKIIDQLSVVNINANHSYVNE